MNIISKIMEFLDGLEWQYVGQIEVSVVLKNDVTKNDFTLKRVWVLQERKSAIIGARRRAIATGNLYGRQSEHSMHTKRAVDIWVNGGPFPEQATPAPPKKKAPVLKLVSRE